MALFTYALPPTYTIPGAIVDAGPPGEPGLIAWQYWALPSAAGGLWKKFNMTRYSSETLARSDVILGSAVMVCTGSLPGVRSPALSVQPEKVRAIVASGAAWIALAIGAQAGGTMTLLMN